MLTPRSDDPNRKSELARREKHPETFGPSAIAMIGTKKAAPSGVTQADIEKANAVADKLEAVKKANTDLNKAQEEYDSAVAAAEEGVSNKVAKKAQDELNDAVSVAEAAYDAAKSQLDSLLS